MNTRPPLSQAQARVYAAIKRLAAALGYSPSIAEVAKEAGLRSVAGVHQQIVVLELLGYIRRQPGKPRSLEVLR